MFLKYNFFTIFWMAIILLLTLVTGENKAKMDYPHFDKVIHLISFCALSFFMIIGFTKQDRYSRLRFEASRYAVLFSIGYGLIIEFVHIVVPEREFESFDLLSNVLGSVLGYFLFVLVYRVLK
jgi:VanZ family protein